jgi:hypothetical protein
MLDPLRELATAEGASPSVGYEVPADRKIADIHKRNVQDGSGDIAERWRK